MFWDSSLAFIFRQFDLNSEMYEKINKNKPKKNGQVERSEKTETQSFRKLSPQEIAELRTKANK